MKPTIRKIYTILILLLITTGVAFAQGPSQGGHITGALLDSQGKPLMFASAALLNAKDSTVVQGSVSNENGVYTFEHIKNGSYIVKASNIGYQNALSQPFSINQISEDKYGVYFTDGRFHVCCSLKFGQYNALQRFSLFF